MESIERLFNEEIKEKKQTGRGAYSKRGKGVKHGFSSALKTPSYFMSEKEKNELNGKVEVKNMYDTVIPLEEFEKKNIEMQVTLLTRWRELYPNAKIIKEMGFPGSGYKYYQILKELGITKDKPKKEQRKASAAVKPRTQEVKDVTTQDIQAMKPLQAMANGLHIEYNANDESVQINDILTRAQVMLEGMQGKFTITLFITQTEK